MTILLPISIGAAATAIFLWREKQLLQRSVSHLTDAIAPGDWLRRNAQRQRDAEYSPGKTCSFCGHATSQDDLKCDDCGFDFEFSGSGGVESRHAGKQGESDSTKPKTFGRCPYSLPATAWNPLQTVADSKAGVATGPLPDSLNAKEVVNNTTPKRADSSESGARDLHPCRVYPTGRWSTRN